MQENGGGTIVENSTVGLQRDVQFLQQLSKDTGVHVVAGTGKYICNRNILGSSWQPKNPFRDNIETLKFGTCRIITNETFWFYNTAMGPTYMYANGMDPHITKGINYVISCLFAWLTQPLQVRDNF